MKTSRATITQIAKTSEPPSISHVVRIAMGAISRTSAIGRVPIPG
jgi:hypothetical protein